MFPAFGVRTQCFSGVLFQTLLRLTERKRSNNKYLSSSNVSTALPNLKYFPPFRYRIFMSRYIQNHHFFVRWTPRWMMVIFICPTASSSFQCHSFRRWSWKSVTYVHLLPMANSSRFSTSLKKMMYPPALWSLFILSGLSRTVGPPFNCRRRRNWSLLFERGAICFMKVAGGAYRPKMIRTN